jgi:hypothetical protein
MQNSSNLQYLGLIVLAIFCGVAVRTALGFANQRWATTYHHTMSYVLLPPITMVITTLIAGNIALSLGMIGALSIVRFRNPVKNPFELIIFFALITTGIGIAVDFKFGLGITVVVIAVILLANFYNNYSERRGKKAFSLSFEEGSNVHIMEVKAKDSIVVLEENKNLVQFFSSKDPISYNYRLFFLNKSEVNSLKENIKNETSVENIEIRYAP